MSPFPPHSISPWSSDEKEREIGRLHARNLFDAVETTTKMLYAAGMSQEEVQAYVANYRANLEDLSLKIYHPWYVQAVVYRNRRTHSNTLGLVVDLLTVVSLGVGRSSLGVNRTPAR